MKIETKILEEFLTKARIGQIETCLLDFRDDGLHISSFNGANTSKTESFLKAEAFKEYQAIGGVGVDNLNKLITIFKRLGKHLSFEIEGNLLTATGNKKELSFELVDEKYIEKTKEVPQLKMHTSFVLSGAMFSEFLKDVLSNKDVTVSFETVDGGVMLSNTGKYRFKYNVDSADTKAGAKCSFGQPLFEALSVISKDDGDITFDIANDMPMIVTISKELYNISILIAPHVTK